MAVREILIYPDPRLREVAKQVEDPTDPQVRALVEDLAETMYAAPGVGLAATQIGVPLAVCVTDTRWREENGTRDLRVWINPEILWRSEETIRFEEGCLSVPEVYEEVERAREIRVRWQDLEGDTHEAAFSDFFAVALQHEFDHLRGKLFIDYLSPLKRRMIRKKMEKRFKR